MDLYEKMESSRLSWNCMTSQRAAQKISNKLVYIWNTRKHTQYKPGCAPSSMTCNFEVICPALLVFEAKQIRTEGFSLPATWINKRVCSQHWMHKNMYLKVQKPIKATSRKEDSNITLNVAKDAACASSAWLRCWSTEKSCMLPLTSCGLCSWHPNSWDSLNKTRKIDNGQIRR